MPRLFAVDNSGMREIPLSQEVSFGRSEGNLVRLEGDDVSRNHAVIVGRDSLYVVHDLNSKNGVLVNGQRVAKALLKPGDELRIGRFCFLFDPPLDASGSHPKPKAMENAVGAPALPRTVVAKEAPILFTRDEVSSSGQSSAARNAELFSRDVLGMHRHLIDSLTRETWQDEDAVYRCFLNAAILGLDADRGVVVLIDDEGNLRLGATFPGGMDIPVNRVVLREVLRRGQALLCNDAVHDSRFHRSRVVMRERTGSMIAFPVLIQGKLKGLIYADVMDRCDAFRTDHLHLLQLLAALLGRSVELVRAASRPAQELAAADMSKEEIDLVKELRASYLSTAKRRARKVAALATLAKRKVAGAMPAIIDLLGDRDAMIAASAQTCLLEMTKPPPGGGVPARIHEELIRGLDSADAGPRQKICEIVMKLGPTRQPLRWRLEEFAARPDCSLPAKSSVQHLLGSSPGIATIDTDEGDETWFGRSTDTKPTRKIESVMEALEKKRSYYAERDVWLKSGKRGPEPQRP